MGGGRLGEVDQGHHPEYPTVHPTGMAIDTPSDPAQGRPQIIRPLRASPAVGEPQVRAVPVALRRQITPPYVQ